ncbi:hypothetical protein [Methylobacillus sp.]|uniref:hypothetical protein n=1 Tax=Methylobacillus sp. TaxID=56818 RepID=UPI002580F938|nr:hypothetical protein [Methylobacillus sp.]
MTDVSKGVLREQFFLAVKAVLETPLLLPAGGILNEPPRFIIKRGGVITWLGI